MNTEIVKSDFLFSPGVHDQAMLLGNLLYSMNYVRNKTIEFSRTLSVEVLDKELMESMNSIGVLLAHIAALECFYRAITFEGRKYNEEEKMQWDGAFTGQMQKKNIKGHTADYYIGLLENERSKTKALLKGKDDNWLLRETLYSFNSPVNNYYCWFHYMEDEMNHFGQMRMIKSNIS